MPASSLEGVTTARPQDGGARAEARDPLRGDSRPALPQVWLGRAHAGYPPDGMPRPGCDPRLDCRASRGCCVANVSADGRKRFVSLLRWLRLRCRRARLRRLPGRARRAGQRTRAAARRVVCVVGPCAGRLSGGRPAASRPASPMTSVVDRAFNLSTENLNAYVPDDSIAAACLRSNGARCTALL